MQRLAGGRIVDFVVSKVAMVICALMVVGVLAEVFDRDTFVDRDQQLSEILGRLCDIIDRAAVSRSEFTADWRVPLSPDGDSIAISIQAGVVKAVSDGREARAQPSCGLHTWEWDGVGLNLSSIVDMDKSSPRLDFRSGETIMIRTIQVTVENEPTLLIFAS
jgi:hypothetical protein